VLTPVTTVPAAERSAGHHGCWSSRKPPRRWAIWRWGFRGDWWTSPGLPR